MSYPVIETAGAWNTSQGGPPRWYCANAEQLPGVGRYGQNALHFTGVASQSYMIAETGHSGTQACVSLWMERFATTWTADNCNIITLRYPDGSYVALYLGWGTTDLHLKFSYTDANGAFVIQPTEFVVDDTSFPKSVPGAGIWNQLQLKVTRNGNGTVSLGASVNGTEVATHTAASTFADSAHNAETMELEIGVPGVENETDERPRLCDILMSTAATYIDASTTVLHLRPSAVASGQYTVPQGEDRLEIAAGNPVDEVSRCSSASAGQIDLFNIDPPSGKTVLGATLSVRYADNGGISTKPRLVVGGSPVTANQTGVSYNCDSRACGYTLATLTGVQIGWESYGSGDTTFASGLCMDVAVQGQAATPRIVLLESFDWVGPMSIAVDGTWKGQYPKLKSFDAGDPLFEPVGAPTGGRDGRGAWKRDAADSIPGYTIYDGRHIRVLKMEGLDGAPTVGFAMKLDRPPGPCDLVSFGTGMPVVSFDWQGRFVVSFPNDVVESSWGWSSGDWHYLEIGVSLDSTYRRTVTVTIRVDGVEWLSASHVYSASFATDYLYDLTVLAPLCGNTHKHPETLVDDLYVLLDGDPLGDIRVRSARVLAAGSSNQWTGSIPGIAEMVAVHLDAQGAFDGRTSRADNALDLYTHEPVNGMRVIKGVAVSLLGYATTTGGTWCAAVKSGATTSLGATTDMAASSEGLPTGNGSLQRIWELDPNTSAPWTEAGCNNAEFGAKVIDNPYTVGGSDEARLWHALLEVATSGTFLGPQPDTAVTSKNEAVTIPVLDNDIGSGPLILTAVTAPSNGTAVISDNSTVIVYSPQSGWTGEDTFVYTVADVHGATGTASVTVTVVDTGEEPDDDYNWDDLVQESTLKKRHRIRRWRVAYGDDDIEAFTAQQIPYRSLDRIPRGIGPDDVWFSTSYDVTSSDNAAADQVNLTVVSEQDGSSLRFFDYNDLVTIDEEWVGERGSLGWMRRATAFVDSDPGDVSSATRQATMTLRGAAKLLMQRPFEGDLRADKIRHGGPTRVRLACVNKNDSSVDYYKFVHATKASDPANNHTFSWCDRPYPRLFLGNTNRQIPNRDGVMQVIFSDGEVLINREYYTTSVKDGGLGASGTKGFDNGNPVLEAEYWRWALYEDEIPVTVAGVGDAGEVWFTNATPEESWVGCSFTVDTGGPGAVTRRWKIRGIKQDGLIKKALMSSDRRGHLPGDDAVGLAAGDTGIVIDSSKMNRRLREIAVDAGFQDSKPFDRDTMTGLFYIAQLDDPILEVQQVASTTTGSILHDMDAYTQEWRNDSAHYTGNATTIVTVYRPNGTANLQLTVRTIANMQSIFWGNSDYGVLSGTVGFGGSLFGAADPLDATVLRLSGSAELAGFIYEQTVTVPPGSYSLFVKVTGPLPNGDMPVSYHVLNLTEEALAAMAQGGSSDGITRTTVHVPSSDEFNVAEDDGVNHQELLEKIRKYTVPNYQYWTDEDGCLHFGVVKMKSLSEGGYIVSSKDKVVDTRSDAEIYTRVVYRARDPELRNLAKYNLIRAIPHTQAWPADAQVPCVRFPVLGIERNDWSMKVLVSEGSSSNPATPTNTARALFDSNFNSRFLFHYSAEDDWGDGVRSHYYDNTVIFDMMLPAMIELEQINVRGTNDNVGSIDNCRIRLEYSKDGPENDYPYWEDLVTEFQFTEQAKNVGVFTSKDFGDNVRLRRLRMVMVNMAIDRRDVSGDNYTGCRITLASVSVYPKNILRGVAVLGETLGFTSTTERDLARRINAGAPKTFTVPFIDEQAYHLARLAYPNEPDTYVGNILVPGRRMAIQKYSDQRAREWLYEESKDFSPLSLEGVRPELRCRDTVFITQPQRGIYNIPYYVREIQSNSAGDVTAKMAPYNQVPWVNEIAPSESLAPPAPTAGYAVFDVSPLNQRLPLGADTMTIAVYPQPVLTVRTAAGAVDAAWSGSARLSLRPGYADTSTVLLAGGGTAGLTLPVTSGTATFTGITVNRPGSYVLEATLLPEAGGTLGPYASDAFTHIPVDSDSIAFTKTSPGVSVDAVSGQAELGETVITGASAETGLVDTTLSGYCDIGIKAGTGEAGATLVASGGTVEQLSAGRVRVWFVSGLAVFGGTGTANSVSVAPGTAGLMTASYTLEGTASVTWSGAYGTAVLTAESQPIQVSRLVMSDFQVTVPGGRATCILPFAVKPETSVPPVPRDGRPATVDLSPFLDGNRSVFPLPHGIASAGPGNLFFNGVQAPPEAFVLSGGTATVSGLVPPTVTVAAGTARPGQSMAGTKTYAITALSTRGFNLSGDRYSETTPSLPVAGTVGGGGGLTVTWTPVAGAAGYRAYRDGDLVNITLGAGATSFVDDAGYTTDNTKHPPSRNGCLWSRLSPSYGPGRRYDRLVATFPWQLAATSVEPRRTGAFYHPKYKTGENMTGHYPTLPSTPDYTSTVWHDAQLAAMETAGFDWCIVTLPLVPTDYGNAAYGSMANAFTPTSFGFSSTASLTAFVTAHNARQNPPKAAFCWDTRPMAGVETSDSQHVAWVMASLYNFYDRYRSGGTWTANIATHNGKTVANGGRPVLVLREVRSKGYAAGFAATIKSQFNAHYGVEPYIVAAGWPNESGVDVEAGVYQGDHVIPGREAMTIGPGYKDEGITGRTTPTRDREGGNVFLHAWQAACNAGPRIVLVDSWNEMQEGTSVCESVEFGTLFTGMNATQSAIFKAGDAQDVSVWPALPAQERDTGWGTEGLTTVYGRPGYQQAADGIRMLPSPLTFGSCTAAAAPNGTAGLTQADAALRPTWPDGIRRAPRNAEVSGVTDGYLAFDVADAFAWSVTDGTSYTVEVIYWDQPVDGAKPLPYLWLEYDAYGDPADPSSLYRDAGSPVRLTNTAAWKYASWTVADAYFGNRQPGGSDFRIHTWPAPVWVMLVRVTAAA